MTEYIIENIDGKLQRIDTGNLVELYADGRWRGGRPVYFYMTRSGKRFFVEQQSHWQGECNTIEEVSREDMIQSLASAKHPSRVNNGLRLMGAFEEIEAVE